MPVCGADGRAGKFPLLEHRLGGILSGLGSVQFLAKREKDHMCGCGFLEMGISRAQRDLGMQTS